MVFFIAADIIGHMVNNKVRLNKYIADCGVCSRRKADELITSGTVRVNGQTVTEMGYKVDTIADTVTVDGQKLSSAEPLVYYLLYKPTGVVSTCEDPQGRRTVLDIIKTNERLYPVGRLDYESSGLLILTNDGDLTHRVTHPSFEIEKEYIATIRGVLSEADLAKLRTGVYIDGKKTHPAETEVMMSGKRKSEIRMVIHEGRNRQVRKMVQAVGHEVMMLRRIQFGPLKLGDLKRGMWRLLTAEEVEALKNA